MKDYAPHQQRVIEEKAAIDENINKLNLFSQLKFSNSCQMKKKV